MKYERKLCGEFAMKVYYDYDEIKTFKKTFEVSSKRNSKKKLGEFQMKYKTNFSGEF